MAQSAGTPLDEIQWREPEAVKFYGGIGAENVHLYFMQSPFCDPTSNNKVLELQARFNTELYPMLASRVEFEKRLRSMSGVEYIVVAGPARTQAGMNPVWVIRKQRRTKLRGSPDDVDTLGTYFAIGENVYQAPSVLDIITCRLMTLTQDLQRVHGNAADMQFFAPSRGYGYAHQPSKRSVTSTRASTFNTPLPDAPDEMAAQSDASAREQTDDDTVDETDLLRALSLSIKYGDDYMDLNPLSGEPGSLVMSSTQGHLRAEKAAKALAASQKARLEGKSASVSAAPSPLTGPRAEASRKGVKSEKEKTPAAGPSNKLKRRKSRTTGSPDGD